MRLTLIRYDWTFEIWSRNALLHSTMLRGFHFISISSASKNLFTLNLTLTSEFANTSVFKLFRDIWVIFNV